MSARYSSRSRVVRLVPSRRNWVRLEICTGIYAAELLRLGRYFPDVSHDLRLLLPSCHPLAVAQAGMWVDLNVVLEE